MSTDAIRLDPSRPDDELLGRFEGLAAALLLEAQDKQGALTHDFRPAWPCGILCGVALTVQGWPGDNLMLHRAISVARPGDVLVATVNGFTEGGLWGEIATTAALERGMRGLVTDGAVRDVAAISRMNFPMFSRGLSIKGTTKKQGGTINHPITLGGVQVHPGDIVVGDVDGVVVVALERAEAVLKKAAAIEAREAEIMAELKRGKLTLDLLNLRSALTELGLND